MADLGIDKKSILKIIRLKVTVGSVTPAPPVGPALGQAGLPIPDVCKEINNKASSYEKGVPVKVEVYCLPNKKFHVVVKGSPASFLIKKALDIKKGSSMPGRDVVSSISIAELEDIAKIKMAEFNAYDLGSAVKILMGTARSMGIKVLES